MTTENPVGLDGIDFVEYSSPKPEELHKLFMRFGFEKVGRHKTKNVDLYRQGDMTFVLNAEPGTFAESFHKAHGPAVTGMGFRVKQDAKKTLEIATSRGARTYDYKKPSFTSKAHPAMYGIGDSLIYFVDTYGSKHIFEEDFNINKEKWNVRGKGFARVDHLTNNVPKGEMQKWCDFYINVFNFKEKRFFDIKGKKTGLISKVMVAPDNKIMIPINEPTEGKSQIQEYLDEYHGSGVQHIALGTNDICNSVELLKKDGVEFLNAPGTYYEMLPERGLHPTERIDRLKDLNILVDGDEHGYLLQIFTKNIIGPIFFEIIQRKNHDGFGDGNFQALFDAIERDQEERGYLK